jgi:hypothetical protein
VRLFGVILGLCPLVKLEIKPGGGAEERFCCTPPVGDMCADEKLYRPPPPLDDGKLPILLTWFMNTGP